VISMRSAEGLAALFLEDATIVTEWGDVVKGRALFASGLARVFANLRGIRGTCRSIRGPIPARGRRARPATSIHE